MRRHIARACGGGAVGLCLEFALVLDGIQVNGVDIIRWNDAGQIEDFKVMVRPLKAINKVWEKMAGELARQS